MPRRDRRVRVARSAYDGSDHEGILTQSSVVKYEEGGRPGSPQERKRQYGVNSRITGEQAAPSKRRGRCLPVRSTGLQTSLDFWRVQPVNLYDLPRRAPRSHPSQRRPVQGEPAPQGCQDRFVRAAPLCPLTDVDYPGIPPRIPRDRLPITAGSRLNRYPQVRDHSPPSTHGLLRQKNS